MIYKGEFLILIVILKEDKYNLYFYKLKRVNSDIIVELIFFDLLGEFWEDRSREKKVKINNIIGNKNYGVSVVKYLIQCYGILILLSFLKEDYNDLYLLLLDGLFRLMLREIFEFKLE